MGKKHKRKNGALDAKAIEKRLEHYGKGDARDKFGKKTNQLAKARALQEVAAMLIVQPETLQALKSREDGQRKWLHEDHVEIFREQKHLDGGSVERAYWHYGYSVALGDVIRLLERENPSKH